MSVTATDPTVPWLWRVGTMVHFLGAIVADFGVDTFLQAASGWRRTVPVRPHVTPPCTGPDDCFIQVGRYRYSLGCLKFVVFSVLTSPLYSFIFSLW